MIKKKDTFTFNILIVFIGTTIVFIGTTLVNIFNLLFQLLIAHRLSPVDFAAFNSLLSILIMLSSPLMTLQVAICKFTAEYKASGETHKVSQLLSGVYKIVISGAVISFVLFNLSSFYILKKLKIDSLICGPLLAGLLGLSWLVPFVSGAVQGIEKFKWFSFTSVITGIFKLTAALVFIKLGYGIVGAFGALIITNIVCITLLYQPLRKYIRLKPVNKCMDNTTDPSLCENINANLKEVFLYMLPVALSSFAFMSLVSMDMILVKYYFSLEESAVYSLAQMVGKIFLFLPGAISIVLLPRACSLNAKNADTRSTLNKSLLYAGLLCACAILLYNLFPEFILMILTGKSTPGTILLGRYFSVSMTLFTLVMVLSTYFVSIKNLKFIKYLLSSACLQFITIMFLHQSLIQIQVILCINAAFLFILFLFIANKPPGNRDPKA